MEGTVNCASLDEGRPALAGTAATATGAAFSTTGGTTTDVFGLEVTGANTGLASLADLEETGMGAGLTGARGLETGWETTFATDFPDGAAALAATFLAGAADLTAGLTGALKTGLLTFGDDTTATDLEAGLGTAFELAFTDAGFFTATCGGTLTGARAVGLAGAAALEVGLPLGLTST